MDLNLNASPQALRLMIAGLGLFSAYMLWDTLGERGKKVRYEAVYGENVHQANVETNFGNVDELPIVFAKGVSNDAGITLSDAAIEAAFRKPVIASAVVAVESIEDDEEEEVEEAPTEIRVTLSQRFLIQHKPLVSGVSPKGAIVGGTFWGVGEKMDSYPVRNEDGEVVYPRIVSVGSSNVRLAIAGEAVNLAFQPY